MLSVQEIARFLSDARPAVRDHALRYLAHAGVRTEVGADAATVVIDRLGDSAYSEPSEVGQLRPSDAAVEWAAKTVHRTAAARVASHAILRELPQAVLMRHAGDIASLPAGALRDTLNKRLVFSSRTPDQLWTQLQSDADHEHLLLALQCHDSAIAPRVMDILSARPGAPMELPAIALAGLLRIGAAVSPLVDRLAGTGDIANAAGLALGRIGTSGAVTMIETRCNQPSATPTMRLAAAHCLARFRVPSVEATLLRLVSEEDDAAVVDALCAAMADVCTTTAFGRLSELAKAGRCTKPTLRRIEALAEMRKPLPTAPATPATASATVAADTSPQFTAGLITSETGPLEFDVPDSDPLFTREPNVARNDLCPCGSGRKYKNCCGKS